jgi:TolA-binding protein
LFPPQMYKKLLQVAHAQFSTDLSKAKSITPISKLSHVRLNLQKMTADNILPLVRQNIKHRNAEHYAKPDLVSNLYSQFRTLQFEIEQLRKKRNDHSQIVKQLLTIENDVEREEKMRRHGKVGKTFRKQV